jgi:protein SCO1/2
MTARRWLGLAALALCCLAPFAAGAGAAFRAGAFEPPRPAPDFALPATDGNEFRLSRARGKVIALTFGYTNCPDVCPTVLAELAQVRARLGGNAQRVQVVYVSVDPERDTAARLRAYTQIFDKTFLGLTGSVDQLGPVWKAYGISTARRDIPGSGPDAYSVHHSASVYLIDTVGRLRVMAPFGTPVDDMVHDVRALLAEGAPAKHATIRLENAWVRRAPALAGAGADAPKTAAYVTIVNGGPTPDTLLSATADAAKSVELHQTRNMSGMMMMEPVPAIVVARGARVELKPGGYHLMLIGLTQALGPGQTVTLTLVFEQAGPVTVRADVR